MSRWVRLGMAGQFVLLSAIFVVAGLGALGFWISSRIENSIKLDAATRADLYVNSFVAPHLQEMEGAKTLDPVSAARIDAELTRDRGFLQLTEARVWDLSGRIIYSTRKSLTGVTFPLTDSLVAAAAGRTAVEFDGDDHASEDHPAATSSPTQLEIYVPVRSSNGRAVIAIAEFYQDAKTIEKAIATARLETWAVVGVVCLGIIAGLYAVVARGAAVIASQRKSLDDRIGQLTDLLQQNEVLRQKARTASQRAAATSEMHLRRVGADLHDGVGQLLTIAMLRLGQLFSPGQNAEYKIIRGMLEEAMAEIRNMSAGLALPEIEALGLREALALMVERHERRTSTRVDIEFEDEEVAVSDATKLCLCRFVQEGLSNAYRHAGGVGQSVSMRATGSNVIVEISDTGTGISPAAGPRKRQPLGLSGLEVRFDSLGGRLDIVSEPGKGTRLIGTLPIEARSTGDG